ncbi:MAG: hypothetical protein ACRCUS_03150, partial [Anaerovoracaceae bacterium]
FDKGEEVEKVKVRRAAKIKAMSTVNREALVLTDRDSEEDADYKAVFDDNLEAPIKKGAKIGNLELTLAGKTVGTVDLVAMEEVKLGGPWTLIGIADVAAYIVFATVGIFILVILLYMLYIFITARKQKKRRKTRRPN